MNYQIYQLEFHNAAHFGTGALDTTGFSICADTLFSALCLEALKANQEEGIEQLVSMAKAGEIVFSDLFPFFEEEFYLPKPMIDLELNEKSGDSVEKKKFKKLQYIPLHYWDLYLKGNFPLEKAEDLKHLGHRYMKVSAAVRGQEETLPYRIETYQFSDGAGLYFILGYRDEKSVDHINNLMEMLSLSGLGGKRSSGLGSFECKIKRIPPEMGKMLAGSFTRYMTLSVALPKEEEMASALSDADFLMLRRGGFISSGTYAAEQMRKKDLYVFSSGSCFSNTFEGDIYDVSDGGSHPVYRYAKPLFMGVR